MKKKRRHSRREFIEGAFAAGAAFAFAKLVRGAQNDNPLGEFGTPLATQPIPQPDVGICVWVSFSPVNDRAVFVAGLLGETCLYLSRQGRPDSFDVLWKSDAEFNLSGGCTWSPNGKEIAFIVQETNKKTTPRTGKISICVADVASGAVREPVIIEENIGGEKKRSANVSYKRGFSWLNDASVCMPADRAQGGGVLKFDTHTGQSEMLIPPQDDTVISNIALTPSGELRFIKLKGLDPKSDSQSLLCGLAKDGSTQEYVNLTEHLGKIYSVHYSQDGQFVFAEKRDEPLKLSPWFQPMYHLIYNIETRSVIGRIPLVVSRQKDIYGYMPLTMRDDNELILIESVSLAADGGDPKKIPQMKIAKLKIS
jgi:hypothetical protein